MTRTLTGTDLYTAASSQNGRQLRRENAYQLHSIFNRISSTSSGANCDRSRRGGAAGITLRKTYTKKGVRASWSKQSCGSRFCPRCSPIQAYIDRQRLSLAVEKHTADGGMTLFATFTAQTKEADTPVFQSAEYAFRRDQVAFTEFRNADQHLPRTGSRQRLKDAAAAYGEEHGLPVNTHEGWELTERLDAFRSTLSRSVFEGAKWKKERETYGIKGRVDVLELVPTPQTKADGSDNWWRVRHNLHFHVVIFLEKTLNADDRELLIGRLRSRWVNSMKRKGFNASNTAQDFQWVAAADVEKVAHYITKFSNEVLFGKSKSSRSVWDALRAAGGGQVVDGVVLPADPAAREWFRQVEQVFQGRKMFNTSVNFYKAMGVADAIKEQEDEFRKNSIMESVLTFAGGTWHLIHEDNPELKYEILNVAENAPAEVLFEFVEQSGYDYVKSDEFTLEDIEPDDVAEAVIHDEDIPF